MESTTRNNKHRGRYGQHQNTDDIERRSLLIGSLLGLVVAPATFRATKYLETETFNADVLATILTLILVLLFSILINNLYQRQQDNLSKRHKNSQLNERGLTWGIFNVIGSYIYGQSPIASSRSKKFRGNKQNLDSSFTSLLGGGNNDDPSLQKQSKIDPKYFKPKFIIHELMTFWDTTCTVITWGSFYVIGGTVVATEKLAQKIKTKRTRFANNNLRDSAHSTSAGRFDSFTSNFTSSPQTTSREQDQEQEQRSRPLYKISTWTKRSFTSVKKKITKLTNSGTNGVGAMPQIEPRGLLNTSFLSGNFRSN